MAEAKRDLRLGKNPHDKHRKGFNLDNLQLFLLSLPSAIWYVLFCYVPMFGIVLAFKNYKVAAGRGFIYSLFVHSKWVGFKNFQFLFKIPTWTSIFRNTILYNVVFIILGIVIPVTLAIMISQIYSRKLAKVCQTAMFFPYFISWVVASYFVYAFLATDRGLVNNMIMAAGGTKIMWYQEPKYWPFLLVVVQLWKTVGYAMVVYLAAISGIDQELYEAALIDGASKTQQIRYITLPLLRPIISILLILNMGKIFNSDFGLFYRIPRDSSSLVSVTQTIDVYVYKALMHDNKINYAAAAGLFQSVLGCITIIISNLVVKKIDPDSGLF